MESRIPCIYSYYSYCYHILLVLTPFPFLVIINPSAHQRQKSPMQLCLVSLSIPPLITGGPLHIGGVLTFNYFFLPYDGQGTLVSPSSPPRNSTGVQLTSSTPLICWVSGMYPHSCSRSCGSYRTFDTKSKPNETQRKLRQSV